LTCLPFPLIPHLFCFPTLLLNLAVGTMEDNKCGTNNSEYWCQKRDALKLKMYRYFNSESRDSSVAIATRLEAERPRYWGFYFRKGQEAFLFSTASRSALGPCQPPICWLLRTDSPGVKRQGREADHSPPSNVEVNNGGPIPPLPPRVFMAWCFIKTTRITLP
jgi:hypothetical protein